MGRPQSRASRRKHPLPRYADRSMSPLNQRDFTLDPIDNARLANLCGPFDEHLRESAR